MQHAVLCTISVGWSGLITHYSEDKRAKLSTNPKGESAHCTRRYMGWGRGGLCNLPLYRMWWGNPNRTKVLSAKSPKMINDYFGWLLIVIDLSKFKQSLWQKNPTLGPVVPLAMFFHRMNNHQVTVSVNLRSSVEVITLVYWPTIYKRKMWNGVLSLKIPS